MSSLNRLDMEVYLLLFYDQLFAQTVHAAFKHATIKNVLDSPHDAKWLLPDFYSMNYMPLSMVTAASGTLHYKESE